MRIAIVEDEDQSARLLTEHIHRFEAENNLSLEIVRFLDGLQFISDYQADFDVIFMDIEMPHLDGMTTAHRLRELDENVCLIFVTNMAQYAIKGYEVGALDFVVKPVRYFSFSQKMERALRMRKRREKTELVLPAEENKKRLDLDDVLYIEVKNHTLLYHTLSETVSARGTISAEEKKLAEKGFARCSNSYLVNLAKVSSVEKTSLTVGGEELPISRTQKADFMKALVDFVGNS
ncbi:MAG: response regulator transcription factor [Lachnospiraceae bacterium]|nr:response regulator transcription factor [Lachnospiraceae bacterium]